MYKIYCDSYLLHDDNSDILRLQDMKLNLELNQLNSFEFTIYPTHGYYDKLLKLKSIIKVYRDGSLIFRGRILDYELGFYNQKQVVCEGELAFLLDSIVRPYEFVGTPAELLTQLINNHNEQMTNNPAKQFVIGQITVTDNDTTNTENQINRSNSNYPSTWSEISEKLVDSLGGFLVVDFDENENRRLNYITENEFALSNQEIVFGENLLDLKITSKGEEVITALIPLGGKEESSETRLDISTLPDGLVMETEDDEIYKQGDYIYSKVGVETYGWIFKMQTWDDVTSDISYLQSVGIKQLNELKKASQSIELNALDISKLKLNINAFNLATKVKVTSLKHGFKESLFPVAKISLNLLNPATNTLSLEKTYQSFTEKTINNSKVQQNSANIAENVQANINGLEQKVNGNAAIVAETTEELSSLINQTSEEIITQVSEKYYLKDETDALISNVETQVKQTSEEVEIRFNNFSQDIQAVQAGTDAQFQNISKYIRFVNGDILLGEDGNVLVLKIQNDRISFIENGVEVAYFSNRKLYVNDGEYINSLKLGNYAFIPRANGNLSFKKVT